MVGRFELDDAVLGDVDTELAAGGVKIVMSMGMNIASIS